MSSTFLTQSLHRARRHYPDRVATICGSRKRTYGQLVERVSRLAGALRKLGMQAGDRVGIVSMNSDRFLESCFAIWWGGGVVNPVNIRWNATEMAHSLDDCQTDILIVDDAFLSTVSKMPDLSPGVRTLIYSGDGPTPPKYCGFEEMIAEAAPVEDLIRRNDDLAGIFYTGGTTGYPKGVMLSHGNLASAAMGALAEGLVVDGDIGLHASPMFHIGGTWFFLTLTMRGCSHVLIPGFQADAVFNAIQDHQVTNAMLVPTMIQMLVDHPRIKDYRVESLKRLVYAASPISGSLLDRAMRALPSTDFIQGYGQTEMSPFVSVLKAECHRGIFREKGKMRSAGRPAVQVEVKIVNGEGAEVPPGTVGEIAARGPGVMCGYWNNPAQTQATVKNGWVHSGDGAYMDEDGFIYIVDRLKDMIITGGENVFSAEVENAIAQHPAVAQCAVIGIPDARWGEAVHAVVVRNSGMPDLSAEDLVLHCRSLIAGYKCPRSVEFQDSLPLSGAGKVLKTELRAAFWDGRSRAVS